jgi:hypothetical protein
MTASSKPITNSRSISSDPDHSHSSCFFAFLAESSRPRYLSSRALLLAVTLLLLARPAPSVAQAPRQPVKPPIVDVELGPRGQWSGNIVTPQGICVSNLPVRLSNGRGPLTNFTTDQQGRFALSSLPTGVHLLQCDGTPRLYRFWKNGTAPPKAMQRSLIITQGDVVRGVQGSQIYDWMSDHPALTYAGIAAAIVVPVVVVGSNQDSSPASP